MDIAFDDRRLARIIEAEDKLRRKYGQASVTKIKIRFAALQAARNFIELSALPGNWHPLTADRAGQWAADVGHPLRLIVRPTPPVPTLADGGVNWALADRVTVVEIIDYH